MSCAATSAGIIDTRVVVVLGPTGSGKSPMALRLARQMRGEIVVADSRQIYRGLRIGSNQPPLEALQEIPHHLLEVVDPRSTFNLAGFMELAGAAIADIAARGLVPIVEGGSMLYLTALCEGMTLGDAAPDPELRAHLAQLALPALRARLDALDPEADVDRNNPVRLVRAIELLAVHGAPLSRSRQRRPPPWQAIQIGIRAAPDLDAILARRSQEMLHRGLVAETRALLEGGVDPLSQALSGIGYRQAVDHLEGRLPAAELAAAITRASRRYARRQMAWWRRSDAISWVDPEADLPGILQLIEDQAH